MRLPRLALAAALLVGAAGAAGQAQPALPEARDMQLLGHHDLQGRAATQPVIHNQGGRWMAYVQHHGGQRPNPLTGGVEWSGTSILDVTDPRNPAYLAHIPGAPVGGESGGAPAARVCGAKDLPKAAPGKTYLLRALGASAHEVWDVSEPRRPVRLTAVVEGLDGTGRSWWECRTGIAYLVADGRPTGWRATRVAKIYDLADPARPRFIRDFGLPGGEPGAAGPAPAGVHGVLAHQNRVYLAHGAGPAGALQIVDRERLLKGDPRAADPFAPTAESLRHPQVGRLDLPPDWRAHTGVPLLGLLIPDFVPSARGRERDIVMLVSGSLQTECQEPRPLAFLVDVTTESRPLPISTYQVPALAGGYCGRGGRFGPHSTSESFTSAYYGRLVFVAYFNAGVRAVDVRDPFHPREVAHFVPLMTPATAPRCVGAAGGERCKVAIQTAGVEADDRGLIYLADGAGTGLHIVELAGAARAIARPPREGL
jgi:hypothetical protein